MGRGGPWWELPEFSRPQRAAPGSGEKARSLPPAASPRLGRSVSHPILRAPPPRLPVPQAGPALTERRAADVQPSGRSGRAGSGEAGAQPWRDGRTDGGRDWRALRRAQGDGGAARRQDGGAGLGDSQLRAAGRCRQLGRGLGRLCATPRAPSPPSSGAERGFSRKSPWSSSRRPKPLTERCMKFVF